MIQTLLLIWNHGGQKELAQYFQVQKFPSGIKIKYFLKWRKFVARKLALKQLLKEVFQTKGKWYQGKTQYQDWKESHTNGRYLGKDNFSWAL